jgi:hypothetical protein
MLIRILAAALAGTLVFFLLGYVIYGILLDPILKNYMNHFPGLMKEPMPDLILLFAWNFVMAFLFALVFDRWAGVRTFMGGLQAGAILMFLIALMTDLSALAFMNLWSGLAGVVIDVLAATVLGAIAAGVIGWVLGFMDRQPAVAAATE